MTFHPALEYFPNSAERACMEIGVQHIEVPMDGKYHPTRLLNNSFACLAGEIVKSPNGDCGFAYNRKTKKRVFFIIREALPKIDVKQVKVKKSRKHLNPDVHHKFQVLRAILDDGVGQ